MRALWIVVAAASLPACIDPPPTDKKPSEVIGGTMTPEGQFPGVGALYLPSFGAMCTGTLIAPDVVLTAAHCIEPEFIGTDIPGFTLAHDTLTSQPAYTAGTSALQHEMFDIFAEIEPGVGIWYDIGLLFLAEPITSVEPVKLPTTEDGALLAAGMDIEIVGYGRTSNETFDYGVMFNATTDLAEVGTHELRISTPGAPQNCHGDSGGPGLIDFGPGPRVVGVVSRSADGTGECLGGGIDTRVDAYLDWILEHAPQVCVIGDPRCTPDAAPPPPDAAPVLPDADEGNPGDDDGDGGGGCCSSSRGNSAGALGLALVVGLALVRRRRART